MSIQLDFVQGNYKFAKALVVKGQDPPPPLSTPSPILPTDPKKHFTNTPLFAYRDMQFLYLLKNSFLRQNEYNR